MVDYNEIINALNDLKPYQQKTTLKINVPNIVRSVPNYRTEQLINGSKNFVKGAGILGASIPFYKDIAFPVANDLYNGIIKGDVDKSKTLQFFMDIAGIDKNGNKTITNGGVNDSNLDKGLVPMGDLDMAGESDLLSMPPKSNQITKQQAQNIVNSVNNKTQDYSPIEDATTRVPNQDDINIVNDYLKRLQDATQPYIDMLSDYVDNYNTNLDDYRRARKFYTGLAGWSGNSRFADLAQDYNPFVIQSNRLALAKQMQDAMMNDINAINELQGNMALAKEMELPPEAAFANKNLLTALSQAKRYATDLEKARIVDAMRRYGYDRAYDRALAQQKLRNLGMENVANINAQAYGYGGMAPGIGLTQQGTAQIQQPKAGTLADDFNKTK